MLSNWPLSAPPVKAFELPWTLLPKWERKLIPPTPARAKAWRIGGIEDKQLPRLDLVSAKRLTFLGGFDDLWRDRDILSSRAGYAKVHHTH
jgi:hypothetical protein